MKKILSLAALVGSTLITGQASADAPDVQFKTRSHMAQAGGWSSLECGYLYIDVGGTEDAVKDGGGPPVSQNIVWASFYSYDYCTGENTQGWGFVEGGFDGNLNSALLDASFEAHSYQFVQNEYGWWDYVDLGPTTVEITADLSGDGEVFHGMSRSMYRVGEYFTRYRWNGESREATVEMSVTVGGEDVAVDQTYGNLSKNKSGYTEIYG